MLLKFLVRTFYHNKIYTDEPEIFYSLYKWKLGLYELLSLRKIILLCMLLINSILVISILGITLLSVTFGSLLIGTALLFEVLELRETKRCRESNLIGLRTPAQIRTLLISNVIRKFITLNEGKALNREDWKSIKKNNIELYRDLLCDECDHTCYYYSLKIAKIVKGATLIWGAYNEPIEEGQEYYAYAVIMKNGYIYDSNMRQSEKYGDFLKLYKFKAYKIWEYDVF